MEMLVDLKLYFLKTKCLTESIEVIKELNNRLIGENYNSLIANE